VSGCNDLARVLDADRAELDGSTDSELARHIADCPLCASAARAILAMEGALDRALATHPELDDPRALVARALEEPPAAARRRVPGWVPLVAAAGAAGLLLLPRAGWGPATHDLLGPPEAAVVSLGPPDVAAPAGTDFAVLRTDDPDITVVWIFQGEG
jgi:anti-sigma factor RsiW